MLPCGRPSIDFYLCFMGRKMIEPTEGDNRHEPKTERSGLATLQMRGKVLRSATSAK